MDIKKILLTENDCYKSGRRITPKGIVVHSTGANNKKLNRYIAPDDGIIGANRYNNHWNRAGVRKCVHAFIGEDASGKIRVYQTLPFNMRCWGIGSGKNGSYNDDYLQFEICEDDLNDEAYFNAVFAAAADFCAYLMLAYPAIDIANVISHNEGYKRGFGSGHSDCDHWLARFGKNMDWFRDQVQARRNNGGGSVKEEAEEAKKPDAAGSLPYRVRIDVDSLNVREGAGTQYKINTAVSFGEVFTIVEESNGWGKLKSGAGWISLYYTKKIESAGGSVKEEEEEAEKPEAAGSLPYKVRIKADSLNVRAGAGMQYKIKTTVSVGEVFTIVEESNGWGKLKSGAGWISLYYTDKLK